MSQGATRQRVLLYDANGNPIALGQAALSTSLPVVQAKGELDTGNSTTTALLANQTFTGTSKDVLGYSSVVVNVIMGHNDASYYEIYAVVQFSHDNVTWISEGEATNPKFNSNYGPPKVTLGYDPFFTIYDNGIAGQIVCVPTARYMRVVVVNGATALYLLNVQTILYQSPLEDTFEKLSQLKAVNANSLTLLGRLPTALVGGRLDTNNGAWLGSTAPTVGSKTSANSLPVVLASDQTQLPTTLGQKTRAGSLAVVQAAEITYSAATGPFASANTATDFFAIVGSGTKTVNVRRIRLMGTQTTAGIVRVLLNKRSADNTGGTSANPTKVPWDSADAAATAIVRSYTVNPAALGTLVGAIDDAKILVPTTTGVLSQPVMEWDFVGMFGRPLTLRGTAEILALNLNSTTITGNSWAIFVEWSEMS